MAGIHALHGIAAMNHIYSSRDIETACRRDINFMYLLEGKPAPDHATIARFLSLHLSQCSKKTLAEVTEPFRGNCEYPCEQSAYRIIGV